MDAVIPRLIFGEGTSEACWQAWLQSHPLPAVDAVDLLADSRTVHVVAPHPDDEILACGGLIRQMHRLGAGIHVIAVTDGEASHPQSRLWTAAQLAGIRTHESEQALAQLGVPATRSRLAVPDGEANAREHELAERLAECFAPGDMVIVPWRLDGHPDHEAAGRAGLAAAQGRGCRGFEAPIWGWHWADPRDDSFPWQAAVALALDDSDLQAKRRAVRQFRSQLEPDPTTGSAPILPAFALARMLRPYEVLLR
ncbi:PIG-L deacetylase family protein [Bordetella genomosp. 13]|uniref:PIG-L deacetylase family protein n=1 Tax=Bordetella genomosp. 13 TaxID=463040 RepID=UPI0011A7AA94|nr:PIG-L family deacetylase [Bordetella genomosp. 13]